MLRKLFCSKFCLIFLIVLVGLGFLIYKSFSWFSLEDVFQSSFVQKQVVSQVGQENSDLIKLAPRLLGFTKPMTYLILFENNTELRPCGGFIGSYAVLKVDGGKIDIIKLDGTENLDRYIPEDFKIAPPAPLKDHLGVDRWYFRDANWSPDFAESAKQALFLYKGENGVEADSIDAVVGFTPTVLEKMLEKIGPVSVDGIEFTTDNVTEKLEYEVEYDYVNKGIAVTERKAVIEDLFLVILSKVKNNFIFDISSYVDMFNELGEEKQIMIYSLDNDFQKVIRAKDWAGEFKKVDGDYLLWVDANLAALKTDVALEREMKYSLKNEDDKLVATTEINYKHTGHFDWRTSRYRTYARIFVPEGSELISVDGAMKWDRTSEPGVIDQGVENGKTWFGTFLAVEPGQEKTLRFTYYLPDDTTKDSLYTLLVQKQLGTINHKLTLDLDFGKTIVSAKPEEERDNYGDSRYSLETDLRVDREFNIQITDSR